MPRRVLVRPGDWIAKSALWPEWTHVGCMNAISACTFMFVSPALLRESFKTNPRIDEFEVEPGRLRCGRRLRGTFRSADFTAAYALEAHRCRKCHP